MDEIIITGLALYGYHGCFPEERSKGQPFIVDLVLRLDLTRACRTDDLTDTVDYGKVCSIAAAVVEKTPYNLVEAAAQAVGDAVLKEFGTVESLTVTLHKPEAPLGFPFTDVAVRVERKRRNRFYVGLGSNEGDREGFMTQALQSLADDGALEVQAYSSLYETAPWGKEDQPLFLNAVAVVDTALTGAELLMRCRAVERSLGRIRHEKWGARTIDLDLLFSGREESHTAFLEMPHPYLTERAFVLVPLLEVAGNITINGKELTYWLKRLPEKDEIKKVKQPVRGYFIWKKF